MRYLQPAALAYWHENAYRFSAARHHCWNDVQLGYGTGPPARGAASGPLPLLFSTPTFAAV